MNIELKIKNVSITIADLDLEKHLDDFEKNRTKLSEEEIDFSSIHYLQGNKEILQMAYENQKIESLEI